MWNKPPVLKKTIKAKATTNINTRKASDAMIELLTVLFLKSLAEEAKTKAFEEKSATIRPEHVRNVAKEMLKKSRG
ncbi:centromere protein W [Salarias fasciatus]|uniref:centromere protein W n=1 Tax=Salarias fasciatus TaxID=181472 RepID=UPI0011767B1E|nr:centromere protein W [Salarias fasciatus]